MPPPPRADPPLDGLSARLRAILASRAIACARRHAPGLALLSLLVGTAFALHETVPSVSVLLWAMGLGIGVAPLARAHPAIDAGVRLAAGGLLRLGVALLGLQVSLSGLADLGLGGIAIACGTVVATLLLTVWAGRLMRVPGDLALLIATGSAICGASAIVAVNGVTRAGEERVAYAVATVTIYGTAAMLLLPPLAAALGLSHEQTGLWAGASIHEVAQVTAAGAVVSAVALETATLVKLTRVVLLGPVVTAVGAWRRTATGAPRVPLFVFGFLALVLVRSSVAVPGAVLESARILASVLLAVALAALGVRVRLGAVRGAGIRPLALGLVAWLAAAGTGLALVLLLS